MRRRGPGTPALPGSRVVSRRSRLAAIGGDGLDEPVALDEVQRVEAFSGSPALAARNQTRSPIRRPVRRIAAHGRLHLARALGAEQRQTANRWLGSRDVPAGPDAM